ncbi:MAG: hypothetical protein K2Q09_06385 [Phycisphaerales bacterium]|nr:hypothetical protein [Phycisphaerales bacterium]
MSVEGIPIEVEKFLSEEVRSLLALELLVLLGSQRDQRWTVEELSRELRATVEWAEGELAQLTGRGLVERSEGAGGAGGGSVYGFTRSPGPGAEFALGWLVASYPARRFSIIQSLYAPAGDKSKAAMRPLKHFADAFDIRKDAARERKEGELNDG